MIGATDATRRVIYMLPGLLQVQRRTVLDHELEHAEAGDVGCQHPTRELAIAKASARRMIPIKQLLTAAAWAHNIEELADECWVDVDLMRFRIQNLHPAEERALRQVIAARDGDSSMDRPSA
jgi:hypothetical protein